MSKGDIKGQGKRHYQKYQAIRLELKAGGCVICGYSRCLEALDFHHVTEDKERAVSAMSISKLRKEAAKCIVVCANCHREIHAGRIEGYDNIHRKSAEEETPPLLKLMSNSGWN